MSERKTKTEEGNTCKTLKPSVPDSANTHQHPLPSITSPPPHARPSHLSVSPAHHLSSHRAGPPRLYLRGSLHAAGILERSRDSRLTTSSIYYIFFSLAEDSWKHHLHSKRDQVPVQVYALHIYEDHVTAKKTSRFYLAFWVTFFNVFIKSY